MYVQVDLFDDEHRSMDQFKEIADKNAGVFTEGVLQTLFQVVYCFLQNYTDKTSR